MNKMYVLKAVKMSANVYVEHCPARKCYVVPKEGTTGRIYKVIITF